MTDFVTALTTAVTLDGLFDAISAAAPIVGIGVLVGFSYMVIKRAVKGLGRGKGTV